MSDYFFFLLIVLFIGLSIGSFVNVCIYRMPRGISVVRPRSFCTSCKKTLRWYELFPVVSYLFQKGRCRSCGAKISIRYPAVEFLCGMVFVFIFTMDSLTLSFLVHSIFFTLLLVIIVVDWKHLIIPNGIIVAGLIFGVAAQLLVSTSTLIYSLGSAFLAALLLFVIRWIGNAALRKETMGIGDVKLAAMIGLFIGFQNFLLAVWAAAVIGCIYWLIKRYFLNATKDVKLPFGSFLASASFVVLTMSNQINGFVSWLIFQR